ncbi:MAG: peptidylprolyl isomerase [Myxococcota bacterium]
MRLGRLYLVSALAVMTACRGGLSDKDAVARVNGEGIAKTIFEQAVQRNLERYRGQAQQLPPGIEDRIKQSVLRRLIDDEIVAQKAKTIGIAVTPQELDEKFAEQKKRFRTDQAFADYLKRSKNTEEQMKDDLRTNLLRDRVVENMSGAMEVTDEEVQKYYDENIARFKQPEQIKASRILLRFAADVTPKQKADMAKKATKLAKEAKKAGAAFVELAKKESQGPEAARGGDLGWFTRGRMPPEWDNVAFNLAAEAVSDPIETRLGIEIVKVWEKKAEQQRPFDEVKDTIRNSLVARKRNEKRREVLRDLKAAAKVEQLVTFEPARPAAPAAQGAPGMDAPQMPMGHPAVGGPAAAAPVEGAPTEAAPSEAAPQQ